MTGLKMVLDTRSRGLCWWVLEQAGVTGDGSEDFVLRALFEGMPQAEAPYIIETGNMSTYRGQHTVVLLRPSHYSYLPLFLANMARNKRPSRGSKCDKFPSCLVVVSPQTPKEIYGHRTRLLTWCVPFVVVGTKASDADDPALCGSFRQLVQPK